MQPVADALVGRRVEDPRGRPLGVVVDVGMGARRFPKFLLVAPNEDVAPGDAVGLVRFEARDVEALDAPVLRVRAAA